MKRASGLFAVRLDTYIGGRPPSRTSDVRTWWPTGRLPSARPDDAQDPCCSRPPLVHVSSGFWLAGDDTDTRARRAAGSRETNSASTRRRLSIYISDPSSSHVVISGRVRAGDQIKMRAPMLNLQLYIASSWFAYATRSSRPARTVCLSLCVCGRKSSIIMMRAAWSMSPVSQYRPPPGARASGRRICMPCMHMRIIYDLSLSLRL
jgi:hypothetical protein